MSATVRTFVNPQVTGSSGTQPSSCGEHCQELNTARREWTWYHCWGPCCHGPEDTRDDGKGTFVTRRQ